MKGALSRVDHAQVQFLLMLCSFMFAMCPIAGIYGGERVQLEETTCKNQAFNFGQNYGPWLACVLLVIVTRVNSYEHRGGRHKLTNRCFHGTYFPNQD